MRLRLSLKCFSKFFLLILCCVFLLPLIFNFFDSPSHHQNRNVVKEELEKESYREPDTSYLEKAILKKTLGNFEPNFPSESGPGLFGNMFSLFLGEGGNKVILKGEEKKKGELSVIEFGFNMVASDKISLTRNIPDTRHPECKNWHYPSNQPTASVIIVFHNEGFSTLLRTIHSVIKTSPPQLLQEIVLVDDFSDKIDLKERLEDYIKKFRGKVKLYRNEKRLGLIGTRTKGASLATGDTIVFLDAHCECNKNWLVPLLDRIRLNRKAMAVPTIDGIDWNDFFYSPVYSYDKYFRGIFEWGFLYKESNVPSSILNERKYSSEPYKSPTHAGGLFAMNRKYFLELGGYDPGLQIWGGENFELSFKIWQCGGKIEWVPCSRVGHVYRNHMPYGFGDINPKIPVILINYMRVVEVWLDPEFKEYFYTREPTIRGYPIGDISEQLEFKEKNKCKSFKWFMENIAFEVFHDFPPPPPNLAWGEISLKTENTCWDTKGEGVGGGPLGVNICHHQGGSQLFRLNTKGQLGYGERCILRYGGDKLSVHYCPREPTGPWFYDQNTGLLKYGSYDLCATADFRINDLSLTSCNSKNFKQLFKINKIKIW